jgi:hypothetical protein
MSYMSASWQKSVGWTHLLGLIHRHGWGETKAGFVRAWFLRDMEPPTFPLDAEILAKVPKDLPGKLPESYHEMHVLTKSDKPKPTRPSDSPA